MVSSLSFISHWFAGTSDINSTYFLPLFSNMLRVSPRNNLNIVRSSISVVVGIILILLIQVDLVVMNNESAIRFFRQFLVILF